MIVTNSKDLEKLMHVLNNRLFDSEVLEMAYGVGETTRVRVKDEFNNLETIKKYFFDDLLSKGTSRALFKPRAKLFISEIAESLGIEVEFMYSQSFILKRKEE